MSAARRPPSASMSGALGALDHPRAAVIVLALAWLSTAGAVGLFEPTETRYAEVAREMHASGDLVVPRLDGIPHLHKPPLAYWATAAGFTVLGVNEWGARVPAALAGLLVLSLVAPIARRFALLGIAPGIAIWALGGSLLFFLIGRSVASDPYLTAAVAAFWAFAPSPWALAALGAGFLAKGPVVFVATVLPVLVAAAWGRDRRTLARLGPGWGWALFAAVALPWYLVVTARTPGLVHYFVTHQIWERYVTDVHQRGGPPWFFVAVLLGGMLPWTPALLAGLVRLWRERARSEARLLMCWTIVPVVFLSFSGSKLPSYLLPILAGAALVTALGLERPGRVVRGSMALALVAIAVTGWAIGPMALGQAIGLSPSQPVPLPGAAHLGLVAIAYAGTWAWRARPSPCALLLVIGLTAVSVALAPYESALGSPRPLVRVLKENRLRGEPVVEFARFNAGLPFYLDETVRLLEVPRETAFLDPARRGAILVTRDSLESLVARHGRVWILGPSPETEELGEPLNLRFQGVSSWRGQRLGFLTR